MRRIVSLLLILVMLASQAFCAPHTHRGTAIGEPVGHANRPHVHVAGSGSHHHHDDSKHSHHHHHGDADHHGSDDPSVEPQATVFEPLDDHDANAVYCPSSASARSDRQAKLNLSAKPRVVVPSLSTVGVLNAETVRLASRHSLPPPFLHWHCPLYLRNLSLRI